MCASKGGMEASDASSCHISERDCDADKMLCGAVMQDLLRYDGPSSLPTVRLYDKGGGVNLHEIDLAKGY